MSLTEWLPCESLASGCADCTALARPNPEFPWTTLKPPQSNGVCKQMANGPSCHTCEAFQKGAKLEWKKAPKKATQNIISQTRNKIIHNAVLLVPPRCDVLGT